MFAMAEWVCGLACWIENLRCGATGGMPRRLPVFLEWFERRREADIVGLTRCSGAEFPVRGGRSAKGCLVVLNECQVRDAALLHSHAASFWNSHFIGLQLPHRILVLTETNLGERARNIKHRERPRKASYSTWHLPYPRTAFCWCRFAKQPAVRQDSEFPKLFPAFHSSTQRCHDVAAGNPPPWSSSYPTMGCPSLIHPKLQRRSVWVVVHGPTSRSQTAPTIHCGNNIVPYSPTFTGRRTLPLRQSSRLWRSGTHSVQRT